MPIYGNENVIEQIKKEFHYVFESNYPGIPQLEIHEIKTRNLKLTAFQFNQSGYCIINYLSLDLDFMTFTYITDANSIPEEEFYKIEGSKVLVINALQKDDHISHFTLEEALEDVEKVNPKKLTFTHISHKLGLYEQIAKELPGNVMLAYDGLSINL
jgi:phosphoribosyl 1,2-cyclic phosphate phosphodiesterase